MRRLFRVYVQGDYSPIGCRQGDRNTLIELWRLAGYKKGIEIGVQRATFSLAILKGIPDVELYCIDPWKQYAESKFDQNGQDRNYRTAVSRLQGFKNRVTIYKDFSENVVSKFEDKSLDFIFIDGLHSYDGCSLDLIKYCPKVRAGGMVAVHDYLAMRRGGVMKAVDAYTYCHLIHPWFVTREAIPTAFWVVHE